MTDFGCKRRQYEPNYPVPKWARTSGLPHSSASIKPQNKREGLNTIQDSNITSKHQSQELPSIGKTGQDDNHLRSRNSTGEPTWSFSGDYPEAALGSFGNKSSVCFAEPEHFSSSIPLMTSVESSCLTPSSEPQLFLAVIDTCEVLEDEGHRVLREVKFKDGI
jgi:hypothetical protein